MSTNGRRPSSLALLELSDRELLGVVHDMSDYEGWTTVDHVVQRLGLRHDHPGHCVGVRFGYMRRLGLLEKHPDERRTWGLSEMGRQYLAGKLTASQRRALENMTPEQLVVATTALTSRYKTLGAERATLVRREWSYGTGRRS